MYQIYITSPLREEPKPFGKPYSALDRAISDATYLQCCSEAMDEIDALAIASGRSDRYRPQNLHYIVEE